MYVSGLIPIAGSGSIIELRVELFNVIETGVIGLGAMTGVQAVSED